MRSRVPVALLAALLAVGGLAALPTPPARAAACTSVTTDGRCGMDLERAWKKYTKGDPNVLVSYIEGGINWHIDEVKEFDQRIYVNWGETPVPCAAQKASACHRRYSNDRSDYNTNHDRFVNAADWGSDPRVHDANGNGYIDAEDLIVAFSDGKDHDGNGYPSDISGWDFYDGQNDPATYDTAYDHSDGQMSRIHHGCPDCMIAPIKAGAEALDRTDDLAQAWLYTADIGGSVIVSTTADLGYSSFMEQAVKYIHRKGLVMVESSNDFDSLDHQGGMWWPYVLPGNGVVATSDGSKWTRSDYTSWGTHNVFSATTHGGTTSESTPTLGGVIALLLSWGREAARKGLIDRRLTGPEAVQVLRETAKRVTDPTLAWPGSKGDWSLQYGYGIPQLYPAMRMVANGGVPPEATIDSPQWYALFDPTKRKSVAVRGTIDAPRAASFRWVLEAAPGAEPADQKWFPIGIGNGHGSFAGKLGTLKLSRIPKSFWQHDFGLSQHKWLETAEQYTVSLRLTVIDSKHRVARDRRAVAVTHDDTWVAGFPRKLRASGESQPALVDLQGDGQLDVVFGDADGYVHAIDPVTGKELPNWPVHTRATHVVRQHQGVDPGYEPILGDVAVGDVDKNGFQLVAATSTTGRVYLFTPNGGRMVPGFPKTLDVGVMKPPIPRPELPFTRLPIMGAVSGPVLYNLGAGAQLEIIQTGWDGYIHVWKSNGDVLPGWPVKVEMPPGFQPDPGYTLVNDQKLDTPPAIAFLQGPAQFPDLVVRPQYTLVTGPGLQPAPTGFVLAYGPDGSLLPGWPARMPGTVEYYGSAQEFITEGSSAPVAADVTGSGNGPDMIAVGPVLSPPYLINGAGQVVSTYGASASWPPSPGSDIPVAFTTSGAFGKVNGVMTFAQPETGSTSLAQALLQPESGMEIKEYMGAYPAAGGSARPGFPAKHQGINFLGQPIIVDVTGDGDAEIVDGGDSNVLHAYTGMGDMAPGFPKWTTGWTLFAPVAGNLLGDDKVTLVTVTREGYLFAWRTSGQASSNTEWWRGQHDEWNSGRYGTDTG